MGGAVQAAPVVHTETWGRPGAESALHEGIDEWWRPHPLGLEHGWTVQRRPAGQGDLILSLQVRGEVLGITEGVAHLETPVGQLQTYGPAYAWDATGTPLPIRLTRAGPHALRIAVQDQDGRYPLLIDPVLSTPTFSTSASVEALAGAGDVDGDGFDDVIIGVSGGTTVTPGEATVYFGSAAGVTSTGTARLTPADGAWRFGRSVSGAGDLDGDGFDDIVIGSDEAAIIAWGSPTGPTGGPTLSWPAAPAGVNGLGWAVAGVGDLNGDGYPDVAVGAPEADGGTGAVLIFDGGPSGPDATPATVLWGVGPNAWFGIAIAAAGDVNADGFDDLIVGASTWAGLTGYAAVFHGAADGVGLTPAQTMLGAATFDNFGRAVAGGGDVNGDGYADVVIGAFGGASSLGLAAVYPGAATGVSGAPAATLIGPSAGSKFGHTVAILGDVDGDGFDDVAAGGHGTTLLAGVYHGSAAGVDRTAAPALSGGVTFGKVLAKAGDVDADGLADLVVADPGATTVSLFHGDEDADADGIPATEDCDDGDDAIGGPDTGWLDTDGDGFGAESAADCTGTAPLVDVDGDCDDEDPDVHPDAAEAPGDGIDQDCDGEERCYLDGDADGYLPDDPSWVGSALLSCAEAGLAPATAPRGDCDDTDPTAHPGATESCDDVDNDCDGDIDSPVPADAPVWAPDGDGDGAPNLDEAVTACSQPAGTVPADGVHDCNDNDPAISPSAEEIPGDGVDNDCDGRSAGAGADGPAGDTAASESPGRKSGASGCTHGAAPRAGWLVLLVSSLIRRRR